MSDLIRVVNDGNLNMVSARDLTEFLGINERFSKWFSRMLQYGFEKITDYTPYQKVHPQNKGMIKDYYLTLDMAKELSMLARNDKGKQARKYFIEVEKRAREISKPQLPQSFSEALQLAANQAKQLELQAPKVQFFDTVTKSDSWLTFKEVSNMLAIPELGRNNLMKRLREIGYLTQYNKPYQKHIDQKLFKVIESKTSTGRVNTSTVVSQKGLDRIIKELKC